MAIMVLVLTTNLIPDPQRSEEEKLIKRPMLSQYPPMTGHIAKAIREIPHHYPAYGRYHQDEAVPCHKTNMPPPKYKTFKIPQGGIVIRDNDGKRG
jgi:hypothetical protein